MFYEDFYNSEEEVLPENEPKKGFFLVLIIQLCLSF